MASFRSKPSLTSLIAFVLILSPLVYVLSYAPAARVLRRTIDVRIPPTPAELMTTALVSFEPVQIPCADGSLYPAYKPVDWLIDNTPLREPLFFWADICGVRDAFEHGARLRRQFPPGSWRTEYVP